MRPSPSATALRLCLFLALGLAATSCGKAPPPAEKPTDTGTTASESKGPGSEEPKPDLSIPVGTPDPPFAGDTPKGALRVDRTGTYGGTFVYPELGEVDTFNPIEPKGATSQEMRNFLFGSLVEYRNGGWRFSEGHAESWKPSDDHLTWTFVIREGVRWSDGQPFTIEDVKFTFDAVFDERYHTSIQDGFRDSERRLPVARVVDERTIEFKTFEVSSQFLTQVGNVRLIPRHKWEASAKAGTLLQEMTNNCKPSDLVGTGPFRFVEYVPDQKVVLERNPYYWKVDARGNRLPYLDRVVVAIVKDQNLQYQKFANGEFHVLMDLPPDHFKEAADLEKNSNGAITLHRLGLHVNTYWVCFNLYTGKNAETEEPCVAPDKQYWFHNKQFRVAVNHAIDRDGLVRSALQGRGGAIWSYITAGNKQWYHPGVPKFPHDPARANAILDELGWKRDPASDGFRKDDRGNLIEFSLITNSENNVRQQIGALIAKNLQDVGIKVAFSPAAFNTVVDKLQDSHMWDMVLLGWGSGVPPDPCNMKNITRSSGRLHAWNPGQATPATPWEARIDELVSELDHELDDTVRKKHSDELQEVLAAECAILYLVSPNAYAASKGDVGNLWRSVLRPQLTWNIAELYLKQHAP